MNKTAICTVSSANYFAFAQTLLQSVEQLHPDCDRFFLLVDKGIEQIDRSSGFTAIALEELRIDNLLHMAFAYDIVELNTSVKPFLFEYLLNKGYQKIIYLDPDIYLYNRLDTAIDSLDTHSIVLTPHSVHPAPPATNFTSRIEHEKNMSVTGIFNLGFIGMADTRETREFLSWWQNRCSYLCYIEPAGGIFVDQKWAELTIAYWDTVHVLRDPGYNVSIWNLHGRSVKDLTVNGTTKLVFYHFSSIDIRNPSILSKHEPSVRSEHHPELRALFDNYRRTVIENGYDKYKDFPYGFNVFADGHRIDLLERRLFAGVADRFQNPFAYSRKGFYAAAREFSRTSRQLKNNFTLSLIGLCARVLFQFIGPAKYRALATFLGKSAELRAHTFLLD